MWTLSFGELLLLQIKLWSQGEGGEHSCAQTEDSPHLQLSSVMYQKEKKKNPSLLMTRPQSLEGAWRRNVCLSQYLRSL